MSPENPDGESPMRCSTTIPLAGHPKFYARDGIPKVENNPDGQTTPTPKPKQMDFKAGGELGLRKFVEHLGHTFVPLLQL
jgi:formate dehydrogenase